MPFTRFKYRNVKSFWIWTPDFLYLKNSQRDPTAMVGLFKDDTVSNKKKGDGIWNHSEQKQWSKKTTEITCSHIAVLYRQLHYGLRNLCQHSGRILRKKPACLQFSFLLWVAMVECNLQHCFITPASTECSSGYLRKSTQPHLLVKSERMHTNATGNVMHVVFAATEDCNLYYIMQMFIL